MMKCDLIHISLIIFAFFLLLTLAGCSDHYKAKFHDDTLFQQMGKVNQNRERIVNTSGSGMTVVLPAYLPANEKDNSSIDGIHFGGLHLLSGWDWLNNDGKPIVSEYPANISARPDFIEREFDYDFAEQLVLSHENAALLIQLDQNDISEVNFVPGILFYHYILGKIDFDITYDTREKSLVIGSPTSGYLAIKADAHWDELEKSENFLIMNRLHSEPIITDVTYPGAFHFSGKDERTVIITFAKTRMSAVNLAEQIHEDLNSYKESATDYCLSVINRSPFFHQDKELEAYAAWDRWYLLMNFSDSMKPSRMVPSYPTLTNIDLFSTGRSLTAWHWATAGDTTLIAIVEELINNENIYSDHIEQYLGLAAGYMDLLEYSNVAGIESRLNMLASLSIIFSDINNSGISRSTIENSRWVSMAKEAGIDETAQVGNALELLAANVYHRARLLRTNTISSAKKIQLQIPELDNPNTMRQPEESVLYKNPQLWNEDDLKLWNECRQDQELNLATLDYLLVGNRNNPTLDNVISFLDSRWDKKLGMSWSTREVYPFPVFPSTTFLSSGQIIQRTDILNDSDFNRLKQPNWNAWYQLESNSESIPADTWHYNYLETVSERIRYLYESLLGIDSHAGYHRLLIAPPGRAEDWMSRASTFQVNVDGARFEITMDPFNGIYIIFPIHELKEKYTVEIKDVWRAIGSLSGSVEIRKTGKTELVYSLDDNGQPVFKLNGVQMKTSFNITRN